MLTIAIISFAICFDLKTVALARQIVLAGGGMDTLEEVSRSGVGGVADPAIRPVAIDRGMLVSIDLDRTQAFLEEFFDFTCVRPEPTLLIARHNSDARSNAHYWVLAIRHTNEVRHRQNMYNHWGVGVPSRADVDNAYSAAVANKDRYGIKRVQKPTDNHGSYSFYIEDLSSNWWEVELRPAERAYHLDVKDGDRFVPTEQ